MPAHEENWVLFQREVDDVPAMLRVDVGYAEEDHDGLNLPAVVEFSTPFKTPSDQLEGALPTAEEFDDLGALEEELVASMTDAGGVMIAAMGAGNTRRWIFYAPNADAAGAAMNAIANPAGYEIEVRVGDDASWSMYHDFFLPDDQEMALIAHEGVFAALADSGDIPERERAIEHLVYLPTEKAAEEFASWARQQGFTVMNRFEAEDAEEDMPSFGVEFSKVRPAMMDQVIPDIDAATEQAEHLDGFYDGWQTTPVTE